MSGQYKRVKFGNYSLLYSDLDSPPTLTIEDSEGKRVLWLYDDGVDDFLRNLAALLRFDVQKK